MLCCEFVVNALTISSSGYAALGYDPSLLLNVHGAVHILAQLSSLLVSLFPGLNQHF